MKILFPKKSREIILDKISKNQAPKDFFYGSISYNDFDIHKQVVELDLILKIFLDLLENYLIVF